ncbi:MAG: FHA domain-containing protein [Cystobacterineae bacterium]|nr:FHA domain-containing protein [Cystobacterineae bacterium]
MSDGLQIPEHLWKALELMEQEMGVPKNNLVHQAIFTLARLNGYVVAGQVSMQHPSAEAAPAFASTSRGAPGYAEDGYAEERVPPSHAEEEYAPTGSRPRAAYATPAPRESSSSRRPALVADPPPPQPLHFEEPELPEEEYAEAEVEAEVEAELDGLRAEVEAEGSTTLYIEIPGKEPFAMEGYELIIGRGKDCHFVIDSNRVSRQHARILRDGNEFVLEDLNSSNGTFYGKHREEKVTRRIIDNEDEFIFGTERVIFYIQKA